MFLLCGGTSPAAANATPMPPTTTASAATSATTHALSFDLLLIANPLEPLPADDMLRGRRDDRPTPTLESVCKLFVRVASVAFLAAFIELRPSVTPRLTCMDKTGRSIEIEQWFQPRHSVCELNCHAPEHLSSCLCIPHSHVNVCPKRWYLDTIADRDGMWPSCFIFDIACQQIAIWRIQPNCMYYASLYISLFCVCIAIFDV